MRQHSREVIADIGGGDTTNDHAAQENQMLRFNDGVNIDTKGSLRVLRLRDGYYVVGKGMSIPVADREEALAIIEEMSTHEHTRDTGY